MPQPAIIEFRDFFFQYFSQAEPTLHYINLKIYPGEKALIVGPSGSGKSTLGHCINGLVPFSYKGEIKGSLQIRGVETRSQNIFKLSKIVGTVLQDTDGQFVGLTVGEDIAFALENDNVPHGEMQQRVRKVAQMVDMGEWLTSSPFELSGGQKQRTSLAGVMIDDVEILLFDEPLANLDPATGKTAIEIIDDIHQRTNKTILIIEHRLEDVLHRPVDRVIVVNDGRITADMDAHTLVSSPILRETGIREPLYVTALKYAGVRVTPELRPGYITTLGTESIPSAGSGQALSGAPPVCGGAQCPEHRGRLSKDAALRDGRSAPSTAWPEQHGHSALGASLGHFHTVRWHSSATAATVRFAQPKYVLLVGDSLTLELRGEGVERLGGWQAELAFAPAIIELTHVTQSSFLTGSGRSVVGLGPETLGAGQVALGAYSYGSPAAVNGDGALTHLRFRGLAVGSTTLALSDVILASVNGADVSSKGLNAQDAEIVVVAR